MMANRQLAFFCINAILFPCVLSFSVYGAWNEAASFLGIKRSVHSIDVQNCAVRQIHGVEQFDAKRFSGDWHEMAKTRTSVPFFKSAIWRFQPMESSGNLVFFFSARVESGHCLNPFVGELIPSNTNPGTLRLSYDGLKARVEEELKLIYTDYDNIAVLYACRHVMPDTGFCHPDAVFASVLSRHHTLTEPAIFSNITQSMNSICMDNQNFIPQNGTKSCNLDELEARDYKDTISEDQWPVCKHPAVCTLACPPCCRENDKGCIICDCQKLQMDNPNDRKEDCSSGKCSSKQTDCVTDISKCPSDCHVVERIAGCKECVCTEIGNVAALAGNAAPTENSQAMYKIDTIGECPATCRTVTVDGTLLCNCTNQRICKLPEQVGECRQSLHRYFFHAADETCRGFLYGGCNGNENNFESIKECYATCKDVCDLPLDVGDYRGDSNDDDSPAPPRYYYNRVTESCTDFLYHGRGGNQNNFQTKAACQLRCPEGLDKKQSTEGNLRAVCKLKPKEGNCELKKKVFYFDSTGGKCVPFFYTGCGGNGNRFETLEKCTDLCIGTDYAVPSACNLECDTSKCVLQRETCMCDCDGATSASLSFACLTLTGVLLLLIK